MCSPIGTGIIKIEKSHFKLFLSKDLFQLSRIALFHCFVLVSMWNMLSLISRQSSLPKRVSSFIPEVSDLVCEVSSLREDGTYAAYLYTVLRKP